MLTMTNTNMTPDLSLPEPPANVLQAPVEGGGVGVELMFSRLQWRVVASVWS